MSAHELEKTFSDFAWNIKFPKIKAQYMFLGERSTSFRQPSCFYDSFGSTTTRNDGVQPRKKRRRHLPPRCSLLNTPSAVVTLHLARDQENIILKAPFCLSHCLTILRQRKSCIGAIRHLSSARAGPKKN